MSGENVLNTIKATIEKHEMISPGDNIVIGLSGGPDSACLVHALSRLGNELKTGRICAVHVNHGLRAGEADRDEAYSKRLAHECGAEFFAFHFDIESEAKTQGISTEAAGRIRRYEMFAQVAAQTGAEKTAVAHNRNDQTETILMRILRGTGVRGLSGIEYVRGAKYGKIIRPLLDVSRAEIEEYCESCGIVPMRDSTNDVPMYARNRVRLELLPYLRENWNPSVDEAIVKLGKIAAEMNDYMSRVAGNIMDECWNEGENSLSYREICESHPTVIKSVIMEAARRAGADADISEAQINSALSLFSKEKSGKETEFSHGYYVRNAGGKLWFLRRETCEKRGCGQGERQAAAPDGTVPFPFEQLKSCGEAYATLAGRTIRIRLDASGGDTATPQAAPAGGDTATPQAAPAGNAPGTLPEEKNVPAWERTSLRLDLDALENLREPVFRTRRSGDRIRPRGMKGHKKLQDYMTDRKIPRHMREKIIILADGNDVISAGGEASADCCANKRSKRIVAIEY